MHSTTQGLLIKEVLLKEYDSFEFYTGPSFNTEGALAMMIYEGMLAWLADIRIDASCVSPSAHHVEILSHSSALMMLAASATTASSTEMPVPC